RGGCDLTGSYPPFPPTRMPPDAPTILLPPSDSLAAVEQGPRRYYLTSAGDPRATYLTSLEVIHNGTRPIAIAQLSIPTADIDRTLAFDREIALAGSLLVLLLAALLSPLVVGHALRPLEQMSATAGALAAGDYKQRVTVPRTRDEIGNLAFAFNQMAAGIDQAFEV